MFLTEEDIEFNWETWGNTKPWYCHMCESFLAHDIYIECDGTDPDMPKNLWHPHENIKAILPLTYKQYREIVIKQNTE